MYIALYNETILLSILILNDRKSNLQKTITDLVCISKLHLINQSRVSSQGHPDNIITSFLLQTFSFMITQLVTRNLKDLTTKLDTNFEFTKL